MMMETSLQDANKRELNEQYPERGTDIPVMCRICLAVNVRMFSIAETSLQSVFEKIVDTQLHTTDMRPITACYICCAHLQKCHKLMTMSAKSENVLTEIFEMFPEVSKRSAALINHQANNHSLMTIPVEYFDTFSFDSSSYNDIDKKCFNLKTEIESDAFEYGESIEPETIEYDIDVVKCESDVDAEMLWKSSDEATQFDTEVKKEVHKGQKNMNRPVLNKPTHVSDVDDIKKTSVELQCTIPDARNQDLSVPCFDNKSDFYEFSNDKDYEPSSYESSSESDQELLMRNECLDGSHQVASNHYVDTSPAEKGKVSSRKKSEDDKRNKENVGDKKTAGSNVKGELPDQDMKSKTEDIPEGKKREPKQDTKLPRTDRRKIYHKKIYSHEIHECKVCKGRFSTKQNLTRHFSTHSGDQPYECDICNRRFRLKHYLTRHIDTHSGKKLLKRDYTCNICRRSFRQRSSLTSHLRTHTGEKPFECDVCQRGFTSKFNLKNHLRTHSGEKPFKCDVCNARYVHRSSLKQHKMTHTGERPHKCDVCHRGFTQSSHLKDHKKSHY